jgi:hypothetical protein
MDADKQRQMLTLFGELRGEAAMLDAETKRNVDNIHIFEAMIRFAYEGVTLVVAGHHIMFMRDGVPVPGEIASADTLIFDHAIASRVWGKNYKAYLTLLAAEPIETRDQLLRDLYLGRKNALERLEPDRRPMAADAERQVTERGAGRDGRLPQEG